MYNPQNLKNAVWKTLERTKLSAADRQRRAGKRWNWPIVHQPEVISCWTSMICRNDGYGKFAVAEKLRPGHPPICAVVFLVQPLIDLKR